MGMITCLFRVEAAELEQILEDSSVLETMIDEAMDKQSAELIDLDKSWEGIIYILSGVGLAHIEQAKPPLSWAVFRGAVIDEEQDLGMGPAHYVDADQVKQVSIALQSLTDDDIANRFDGKKMMQAGIYPEIWDDPDTLEYIKENIQLMKDFYTVAADRAQAVISFLG